MNWKSGKSMSLALVCAVAATWQLAPAGLFDRLEIVPTAANAAPIETDLPPADDWQTISDDVLGFKIEYPGNVFRRVARDGDEHGHVLVSRDGAARLLIAAFDNDSDASLRAYRSHVLASSYAGSDIDYAPVRRSWFVLSGTRDGTEFYERVSFTCSNNRITSWAMLYPYAQRNYYNRVLEQIARTFRPSRTC